MAREISTHHVNLAAVQEKVLIILNASSIHTNWSTAIKVVSKSVLIQCAAVHPQLDHILANSFSKISQPGVLDLGLSDHQLMYCTRKTTRTKIHEHTCIKIRTLRNYTKQLFLDKLSQVNFQNTWILIINVAYFHFIELVTNIIDEIAPMKEIRVRKETQEWMDQEVLEGIRILD